MDAIGKIKAWIGALTDVGLMLLGLAIVVTLLVGGANLPFFGTVVDNIVALVAALGKNGLVGLLVLGVIIWLLSKRSVG